MARGSAYCNGCVYKGIVQGNVPCCNYIFMEDTRRPCPPGEGCTVKTTNREAQRKGAEARKQRKLEQMKQARAKKRLARVHTVVCPICGKAFETDRMQARYCCKECAEIAHKAQLRMYAQMQKEKASLAKSRQMLEG